MSGEEKLTGNEDLGLHEGDAFHMNLRKRSRHVDLPNCEAIRPASAGERMEQKNEWNDSKISCKEISNDYREDPGCKRFRSSDTDAIFLQRARSDEVIYCSSESHKDSHNDKGDGSDLTRSDGTSQNKRSDIPLQLCKPVAMGPGNHPGKSDETAAVDNMTPMKMPSDVHPENGAMRSVMSSISTIKTDKGDVSYKCKLCGVTFTDYFDIYIHIRMHGGERSMRALVDQQKTLIENIPHTNARLKGRPYECLICSRKFKLPKSLLTHVTNIHPTSEDTLIARVPEQLLPSGWLHNQSKAAELQQARPFPSIWHDFDTPHPTTQQSLKSIKLLVETDSALLPAAGGSKILQPPHTQNGALATPPPHSSYRQSVTELQANPPTSHSQPCALQGPVVGETTNSAEIPLDLSSQDIPKRRSPTDGIVENPIPKPLFASNNHHHVMRDFGSHSSPAGKSTLLPPGKTKVPRQSMAQQLGQQGVPQQHFPLQSKSPNRDHLSEYYQSSSPRRASIQDPQVSSDSLADKEDALNITQDLYLQIELERQFNIELDFAELQMRRKYTELGLNSERMKSRRNLQGMPSTSRRELDLHLVKELMRFREMRSSHFEDELESEDEGYDPYFFNMNENPSPSAPVSRHPEKSDFPSQNSSLAPSSQTDTHQAWPQTPIYPDPTPPTRNAPGCNEKGANLPPSFRRPTRQLLIPHLLSQPSRFQLGPTSQAYKKN